MPSQKISIVGANGYLGSQFLEYLKGFDKKYQVASYIREEGVFNGEVCIGSTLINFGTPNEVLCRNTTDLNALIDSWWRNFEVAANFARPSKVIHVSTFHLYEAIKADHNSLDNYVIVHRLCFQKILQYCESIGVQMVAVFPSNIYGTMSNYLEPRADLILNDALFKFLAGKRLITKTQCKSVRDFIWIGRFLVEFLDIVDRKNFKNLELIPIKSDAPVVIRDLLRLTFNLFGTGSFEGACIFGQLDDNPDMDHSKKYAGNIKYHQNYLEMQKLILKL